MAYIGKEPGSGLRGRFVYTATAGQTSFTGSDSLGRTLTYTDSEYTDVFLNGVKLDKTDYTATSGTSIVLDSGASADDTLEILAFDTFGLFSGEFAQDVSVSGDLTISDKIVHSGDTNTAIRFADADTVTIETGGSERLRVNSSGKVGIGDTAPTSKLDLGSDVGSSVTDVTNHIGLFGSLYGFGITSNQLNYVSGADHVFYNTSGNERVRILGTGGLTFNGDTAAVNALDDYEEGTWTPIFTGSSSNPSVTYDIQAGHYRKIGGLVHASFSLRTDAVASAGSGSLYVSGLPFAGTTSSNSYYSGSIGYSFAFTGHNPQAIHIGSNGTIIVLIRNSDSNDANSGLSTAVTTSALTDAANSNFVIGQMTYPTDA